MVESVRRCAGETWGRAVRIDHVRHIRPHVRSTGFFLRCERLHRYPHGCNSRDDCFAFEHGVDSLTQWFIRQDYGVWLVTPAAVVPPAESRKLGNIFRRGNQSNMWTCDRHTDIFESTPLPNCATLSRSTDGIRLPGRPIRQRGLRRRLKNMLWK
jgi:hypothetical protein